MRLIMAAYYDNKQITKSCTNFYNRFKKRSKLSFCQRLLVAKLQTTCKGNDFCKILQMNHEDVSNRNELCVNILLLYVYK